MLAEELLIHIGRGSQGFTKSQLFGKPGFKVNGKACICFYQSEMVFKLTRNFHHEALNLDGAQLFDPSGKRRPMKEWVQVPYVHHHTWRKFAMEAMKYVGSK